MFCFRIKLEYAENSYSDKGQYETKINEICFDSIYEIVSNAKNYNDYKEFKRELMDLKKSVIFLILI